MIIECRARRVAKGLLVGRRDNDDGTKTRLFGKHYHFKPRPELTEGKGDAAAHVCEVTDKRAIDHLLSIPEGFNEFGKPPRLKNQGPKVAPGQPEIVTEMLDDGDTLAPKPQNDNADPLAGAKKAQAQWIDDQLSKPVTVLRRDVHDMSNDELELLLSAARERGESTDVLTIIETRPQPVTLQEALSGLDASDDDHWTKSGLPAVEAVDLLLGGSVTRADIERAAPDLKRDTASVADEEDLNLE